MKYCPNPNKYHGNVEKQIADNEKYCQICKGKIQAKKEKTKKTLLAIGKVIVTVLPTIISGVLNSKKSKKK